MPRYLARHVTVFQTKLSSKDTSERRPPPSPGPTESSTFAGGDHLSVPVLLTGKQAQRVTLT